MDNLYQAEHFNQFIETLNLKGILQYDYFVNWAKVLNNIEPIEKELNLLNTAVGKDDIERVLFEIFKEYIEMNMNKNKDKIFNKIQKKFEIKENIKCGVYHMDYNINYSNLTDIFKEYIK